MSTEDKRLSNISENSEDSLDSGGGYSNTPPADMSHSFNVHNYPDVRTPHDLPGTPSIYKVCSQAFSFMHIYFNKRRDLYL